MRKYSFLPTLLVLLAAVFLLQPVLEAEDLAPPKGHFNISNSTVDEGHTGVVVFGTKKGFVVVWSDDHTIVGVNCAAIIEYGGALHCICRNIPHRLSARQH